MKNSNVLGAVFILIAGVVLGGWLMNRFKPVPDGMVLVPQSTVDSLNAYIAMGDSLEIIANLPPDTVVVEKIVTDTVVKYVETTPISRPDPLDSSVQVYTDTLQVDGEINAWVRFKVKGYVVGSLEWKYKPIVKEVTSTITVPAPYPVIEPVEVPVPSTGNYLSLTAGGNDKMFIFGVDYDRVKEDFVYGLQYRRYGEVNIYGVKAGINLNKLFKR